MPTNVQEQSGTKVQDYAKMSTVQLAGVDPSSMTDEQQAEFYKVCHERLVNVVSGVFFDKRNNALYVNGEFVSVVTKPMDFGKARVVPSEWTPKSDRNGDIKADNMGLIKGNELDLPEKRIDAGYETLTFRFTAMLKLITAGMDNTGVHLIGQKGKTKADLANAAGMVASRIG